MISIDALRDDREEAYKVWFERWWSRADIEREIINANSKGFAYLKIYIPDRDAYTANRMRDNLFLKFLRRKLAGFDVCFDEVPMDGYLKKSFVNVSWDDE